MAWIFDTYSMNKGHSVLGVVTGKPLNVGGSLGRLEATARGALYCIREALRKRGLRDRRHDASPIQGFGNVGSFLAQFIAEEGATVVAVSDSTRRRLQPGRARRLRRARAQAGDRAARRPAWRGADHQRGAAARRLRRARTRVRSSR